MLTPKIGKYRGLLNNLTKPVRTIMLTDQTGLSEIVKSPIRLHYYVDLIEMIEMHIYNIPFKVQMRKLCLPEDLHLGLTG